MKTPEIFQWPAARSCDHDRHFCSVFLKEQCSFFFFYNKATSPLSDWLPWIRVSLCPVSSSQNSPDAHLSGTGRRNTCRQVYIHIHEKKWILPPKWTGEIQCPEALGVVGSSGTVRNDGAYFLLSEVISPSFQLNVQGQQDGDIHHLSCILALTSKSELY